MKVVGWIAYYDDLAVYDSREVAWEDLPDDGLQQVVLFYDEFNPSNGVRYRSFSLSGFDWYFRAEGPDDYIYAGCNVDDARDIEQRYVNPIRKRGRWTTNQRSADIARLAAEARWD